MVSQAIIMGNTVLSGASSKLYPACMVPFSPAYTAETASSPGAMTSPVVYSMVPAPLSAADTVIAGSSDNRSIKGINFLYIQNILTDSGF